MKYLSEIILTESKCIFLCSFRSVCIMKVVGVNVHEKRSVKRVFNGSEVFVFK